MTVVAPRFVDAARDALHELKRRGYDSTDSVLYAHPETLRQTVRDRDGLSPLKSGAKVHGAPIESAQGVPEDVVVAAHLRAAIHGPDAIAFAEVGDPVECAGFGGDGE